MSGLLRFGNATVARVVETRVAYEPQYLFKQLHDGHIEKIREALPSWSIEKGSQRIFLTFQSFVIRLGGRTILVDTCNGNHKSRPDMPRWHQTDFPYLARLKSAGVHPDDVDLVLCSHLHADHVGWNTRLDNGRWVPTFRNARYLVSDVEMGHWRARHALDPAEPLNHGSWQDSVLPVEEAGLLDEVRVDHVLGSCIDTDIRLEHAPGHTPGQVHLVLSSPSGELIYCADTIHHPLQIADPQYALTDADPSAALTSRRGLIDRCMHSGAMLLPAHFDEAGTIERHLGSARFRSF